MCVRTSKGRLWCQHKEKPTVSLIRTHIASEPDVLHHLMSNLFNTLLLTSHANHFSWMLVSLLSDLEVSDLEKWSQSNHKSNGDNLSLRRLKLYLKWILWVFVFCFQRSWPVLWSLGALHGFGWMHVYFQVGMIIGDTEQHNKEYMWLPWRKWLT